MCYHYSSHLKEKLGLGTTFSVGEASVSPEANSTMVGRSGSVQHGDPGLAPLTSPTSRQLGSLLRHETAPEERRGVAAKQRGGGDPGIPGWVLLEFNQVKERLGQLERKSEALWHSQVGPKRPSGCSKGSTLAHMTIVLWINTVVLHLFLNIVVSR